MSKQERPVSKEILERIEQEPGGFEDAGNKVLDVTITYSKNAYRTKPRGYYLSLRVYLETDRGYTQHCLSFGDEGDPHKDVLLQETKAFSQKTFDGLNLSPGMLEHYVTEMKEEYRRRRALQLERRAKQQDTRTRAQQDAAAFAHEHPALVD